MFNHIIPWQLPGIPFDHLEELPEISAIYFVLDSNDRVFYIGQTANLRTRWKGHHVRVELLLLGCKTLTWKTVEREFLGEVEASLLADFTPPYNRGWKPRKAHQKVCEILGNRLFQNVGVQHVQSIMNMEDFVTRQQQYQQWFLGQLA